MFDRKTYIEWYCDTPLTANDTFYPIPGVNVFSLNPTNVKPCIYLTISFVTQLLSTLTCSGYIRVAGAANTLWTMIVPAATYTTTYNLPMPLNQGGRYTIQLPLIRFELIDGAGANHAYTRFYARAWWGG
jgi:hypothetical protein